MTDLLVTTSLVWSGLGGRRVKLNFIILPTFVRRFFQGKGPIPRRSSLRFSNLNNGQADHTQSPEDFPVPTTTSWIVRRSDKRRSRVGWNGSAQESIHLISGRACNRRRISKISSTPGEKRAYRSSNASLKAKAPDPETNPQCCEIGRPSRRSANILSWPRRNASLATSTKYWRSASSWISARPAIPFQLTASSSKNSSTQASTFCPGSSDRY